MSENTAEALLALTLIYLWRNEPEKVIRDDISFLFEKEVLLAMRAYQN